MFERSTDQIRFLAVADAERIVADADRLAMTQSALSRTVTRAASSTFGDHQFFPVGGRTVLQHLEQRPCPDSEFRVERLPAYLPVRRFLPALYDCRSHAGELCASVRDP